MYFDFSLHSSLNIPEIPMNKGFQGSEESMKGSEESMKSSEEYVRLFTTLKYRLINGFSLIK